MLIAAEVRRVLCTKPDLIKLDHFKLKFVPIEKDPEPEQDPEEFKRQLAMIAEANWLAALGIKPPNESNDGNTETASSPDG